MLCLQVARVKTFCGLIPRQLIFNNKPVFVATRLFLTIFLGLMLCGCIYGVPPNVHDLVLENLDGSRIDNVVLTKRVVLERGTKIIENILQKQLLMKFLLRTLARSMRLLMLTALLPDCAVH